MLTQATLARTASALLVAVVDDDDAVRDSLRFLLNSAGYGVATYASGVQFLQEAPLGELSCLVVDQQMPDLTGIQTIARLRALGVNLRVALITSSPSPELVRLAQELGADVVLEKPLDEDELFRFVAGTAS